MLGDRDHPPQKTEDFSIPDDSSIFATAAALVAGFSMRSLGHGLLRDAVTGERPEVY